MSDTTQRALERQRLMLAGLPGTVIALYDHDLRVVDVDGLTDNPDGHTAQSVMGAHVSRFFTPETFEPIESLLRGVLAGTSGALEHRADDGRRFHLQAAPFVENGVITGALSVWHDVTAQRAAEDARRDADRHFSTIFHAAPIGMVLVNLDGSMAHANRAIEDLTGYSARELAELPPFAFVHPDDRESVQRLFGQVGRDEDTVSIDHQIVRADGDVRWVQAQVTMMRDHHDTPTNVLAQVLDITDRKTAEAELVRLADHDPLTGLLNRRRFEQDLGAHLQRCHRYAPTGAVLFIDVDDFKKTNDTLGHHAGDRALVRLAETLRQNLRASDILARLGGDEFAILLPHADRQDADHVVQKLTSAAATSTPDQVGTPTTISVGVRVLEHPVPPTTDAALRDADRAMYHAKTRGGRGQTRPA